MSLKNMSEKLTQLKNSFFSSSPATSAGTSLFKAVVSAGKATWGFLGTMAYASATAFRLSQTAAELGAYALGFDENQPENSLSYWDAADAHSKDTENDAVHTYEYLKYTADNTLHLVGEAAKATSNSLLFGYHMSYYAAQKIYDATSGPTLDNDSSNNSVKPSLG